jgi:hypothetical protein
MTTTVSAYKKGLRINCQNYCGVSLVNILYKFGVTSQNTVIQGSQNVIQRLPEIIHKFATSPVIKTIYVLGSVRGKHSTFTSIGAPHLRIYSPKAPVSWQKVRMDAAVFYIILENSALSILV